MQYDLRPFQVDATRQVLANLGVCARDWRERQRLTSFALSSVTGSGKTVVAATVIEALVHGSTEFDFEPDPGAVVLWVSKEPSLNEQTRAVIMDSADRIPVGDLVVLDNDFAGDRLQKGSVYFLNTGKLASGNLLVKKTNNRQLTFWEVLDNTVRDKNLTLYLILDEAHEGMKPPAKADEEERQTLIARIINGHAEYAPVPIVWGISATVKRFLDAMAVAEGRGTEPNVVVDPIRVQQSGLLKNSLVLDIPDESGNFKTSFVRDATLDFVAVSRRWLDYCQAEKINPPVLPLMVVQISNKEKSESGLGDEDKQIVEVLDTIRANWPDFADDSLAHVLGDRGEIRVGPYTLPRIKPQNVERSTNVRILVAKDAVSTGWDCPRAEVLVSLRPADDDTYITQLLGRMVRTPLKHSTNDDRLNSASCYLPEFNRATARRIAEEIMGIRAPAGSPPKATVAKVLFKPVDLIWNPNVPAAVEDLLRDLPSLPKPAAKPRPIKRLLQAAVALAQDGLVQDPNKEALQHLYAVLDGKMAQYKPQIDAQAAAILEAEVRRIRAQHGAAAAEEDREVREADENTVKEEFSHTKRALTMTVANGYLKRRYAPAIAEDLHADLTAIQARVAALSRITENGRPVVVEAVEDAADQKTRAWLDSKRTLMANLSEERRAAYEDIRAQAREPELVGTEMPTALRVEGADADGKPLPTVPNHVLSDADGNYPIDPAALNKWERAVIDQELARESVVAWYRNPSAASKHSLRIPYKKAGEWKSLQPDFVFVDQNANGNLAASVVDPHSGHLADALDRLLGIADFAEKHGDAFARIDSLDADDDNTLTVLDMKDAKTRKAVREAKASGDLFNGPHARRY